jgi:uncharacterized protein
LARRTAYDLGVSYSGPIVDTCVFHDWSSMRALEPYLSRGWKELIFPKGQHVYPSPIRSSPLYQNPRGSKAATSYPPSGGRPGSSFEFLKEQVLTGGGRERVVLAYDDAILTTAFPNHHAARAVVRAANDWTAEQWLAGDDPLYGLVMVVSQVPHDAAAEIRRVGQNPRMVGVALGANALGQAFGHPVYEPIMAAASELDLPLVLQVGSDASATGITPPVAGGLPATFAEFRALGHHPIMTHVANMIFQGVFVRHPSLRLVLLGCGASWLPGYLWRLNYWFKHGAEEAPWNTQQPIDYFRDRIRISSYGLEATPDPERLIAALDTLPWIGSALMYGSGYPNADSEEAAALAARLPAAWHKKVFKENALDAFRWPRTATIGLPETSLRRS